jgi:hypothetical protein
LWYRKFFDDFFHSLDLVEDKELYPFHAGFLSRLALTIDRGDYPHVLAEGVTQDVARELYHKALEYAPAARAYWGLGLLAQIEGDDRKAEAMLRESIQMFSYDPILARVLNNTLMRLG